MAKLYRMGISIFLMLMVQAVFQACVMDSNGAKDPAKPTTSSTSPSSALSNPNIPQGCFMEWNSAKGDSTLICGDPTPPKMK